MRHHLVPVFALFVGSLLAQSPIEQGEPFRLDHVQPLPWRNLGPVNMGGRVTDLAIHASDRNTWYVATAGGGLWKTRNRGTTWEALFQHEPTSCIGDVAIAPANKDIVWIGTGEENARNSVSFGDGVYKSVDAGRTWTHMGLSDTFQIGHVEIHPTDSDTVFVAALGRLWGPNEARGVYRTQDGGKTFEHVLKLDDATGCIDVRIDPREPNTVYAAMYERRRDIYCSNDPSVKYGAKAGIYRSDDGGSNWKQLQNGLPTCQWGRSGLALHGTQAGVVYAIVETERSGWTTGDAMHDDAAPPPPTPSDAWLGLNGEDGEGGARVTAITDGGPAATAGLQENDVVTALGDRKIAGWEAFTEVLQAAAPETKVFAMVRRPGIEAEQRIELTYGRRPAGGRGGRGAAGQAVLGIQGEDGDGGARLTQVTDGSAAAKAGLRAGDIVLRIDDDGIETYADLTAALGRRRPEETVQIRYRRETAEIATSATLDRRAAAAPQRRAGGAYSGSVGGAPSGQIANMQERQGEKGFETGGIFRSDDRGETWRRLNSLTERPFYYSVLCVDPSDDNHILAVGTSLWQSVDGGKTFRAVQRGIHVDFHALWIDPNDSDMVVAGSDGGMNVSYDRCRTWQVIQNLPIGQYYHADVDDQTPYNVYGGLQDNGTWRIPSRVPFREGITWFDAVTILGGDGFTARIDQNDPNVVYATSQNGGLSRVHVDTGARASVQKPRGNAYRYNWSTPFVLSPHNQRILYFAGNRVFRSVHRGEKTEELTTADLGATERGTATALAESPVQPGLLFVGTDEGTLWRSKDHGRTWEPLHGKLPMPGLRYVSSIHPSHHRAQRVYATFDGHRSDDHSTYVFVSDDVGDTWRSLLANLPDMPVHVCRDVAAGPLGRNEDLLLLGSEFGVHVSLDRGKHWFPLGDRFPTTAARDLVVQNRHSDVVVATHGRGIYVLDIAPLLQLTAEVARKPAHLFRPEPLVLWRSWARTLSGNRDFRAPNPPDGATIHLVLATKPERAPVVTVHDVTGKQIAAVNGRAVAGLQVLHYDGRVGTGPRGARIAPGNYSIRCRIGDQELVQPLVVEIDPTVPAAAAAAAAAADSAAEPTPDREGSR